MQLDFRVDMTPNVESGAAQTKVSIRPSINGQPTKRPYFTGIITKAELDKDYGGDLYNYVAAVKEMANHLPDEELRKFLGKDIINESIPDLDPNEEYYVFAAPYVYAWPYSLCFTKFKYSKGVIYPYTHEQYDASEILL